MPVISFNLKDFCSLVGKRFNKKKLSETLPMMGLEWEGSKGDEISVEVFPNRPDLLSVEGLARAFRSFIGLKKGLAAYSVNRSDYLLRVDKSVRTVRPFVAAAVVKNIKFNDESIKSLMQVQEKLHLTHCRNRVKAAIGIHDLRAVKFPLKYTTVAPSGIKFIPLDSNREMTPEQVLSEHPKGIAYSGILKAAAEYPVILSADNNVVSFPPIINSELTKVRPGTKDLFIDVTGTDWFTVTKALNIVVTSLIERKAKTCSVTVKEGKFKKNLPNLKPSRMKLDLDYCNKLLGLKLSPKRAAGLLLRMGYDVVHKDKVLFVKVPCYRTDLMHPFDLVEDIAISYGYMRFNVETPMISTIGSELTFDSRLNSVRDLLVGFGYNEVINWLLTNESILFNKMLLSPKPVVKILNAKSEEFNVCRHRLTPLMLNFLSSNKHNEYPQKLFEAGDVLLMDGGAVRQESRLCIASAHSSSNYSEVKVLLDSLMNALGIKFVLKEANNPSFINGRLAKVLVNNVVKGFIGEVSPEVIINFDLKVPVTLCELNLEGLL